MLGPEAGRISSLVFDAVVPGLLYASGEKGMFLSEDGGDSFTRWDTSHTDGGEVWEVFGRNVFEWTHSLAFDPLDPETVYTGTHEEGIFVSTNRGADWTKLASGLEGHSITDIALDPSTGRTIYVVAENLGIAKLELLGE